MIVSQEQLHTLVDSFFEKIIGEIRPVEDRRERNRYLMMFRRRLYQDIYKVIDPKLSGPGRGNGTDSEEEEIRELWNTQPLISLQAIADMYALSVEGCRSRLVSMKRRGLEVIDAETRQNLRLETQRELRRLHPKVKQAKKPRAFECTECTYRWIEYMTAQQWQNFNDQKETAACKKCKKVGAVVAW